ncbi:MAG: aminopeptidase P family protein [Brucellaceae bacterium]|jgi:Xaa-Pro aminopeptidase|nr:aminopeptidase P family protein [Brucellaceae bacterium]
MKNKLNQPLQALRAQLSLSGLDGFVVPRFDEHQGEYCAAHDNRLAYITGFIGSAGVALIMRDQAVLFVDGRYQVQARNEVNRDLFVIEHFHNMPLKTWLRDHVKSGQRIGFNAMLLPSNWDQDCGTSVRAAGGEWIAMTDDPVDAIWSDQPEKPAGQIMAFPLQSSGETVADKKARLAQALDEEGADYLLEAQPDNIAWFLNVRGRDVAFNPVPQSFMIAGRDGTVQWLVDRRKLPNDLSGFELEGITIAEPDSLLKRISQTGNGTVAMVDPAFAPSAFVHAVEQAGGSVMLKRSPLTMIKTQKNPVELAGFRAAHHQDGLAWIRFLAWLDREGRQRAQHGHPVSELEAEEKILSCRQMGGDFIECSFRTISAAGANAAMCHYAASESSNASILTDNVYLLDSGGQYLSGTTDATRTTALGAISDEIHAAYTAVLKGLIAMISVQFPQGTQGHHLDALARRPLWALGLDYDHGTGHGVGHFLSVHEQPQRFDKRVNEVNLRAGMVTTIEPGYYKANAYGIRLENQVEVVDAGQGFMRFESLTLVPVDLRLADISGLNHEELNWINAYHQRVLREMSGFLDGEDLAWLQARCAPV